MNSGVLSRLNAARGVHVSGQLQHVVFLQDLLRALVHRRQGVEDGTQLGRGLPLALHAHQLEEELPVGQSEEDELGGLAEHPGVMRGQGHLVGFPEDRTTPQSAQSQVP